MVPYRVVDRANRINVRDQIGAVETALLQMQQRTLGQRAPRLKRRFKASNDAWLMARGAIYH